MFVCEDFVLYIKYQTNIDSHIKISILLIRFSIESMSLWIILLYTVKVSVPSEYWSLLYLEPEYQVSDLSPESEFKTYPLLRSCQYNLGIPLTILGEYYLQ